MQNTENPIIWQDKKRYFVESFEGVIEAGGVPMLILAFNGFDT